MTTIPHFAAAFYDSSDPNRDFSAFRSAMSDAGRARFDEWKAKADANAAQGAVIGFSLDTGMFEDAPPAYEFEQEIAPPASRPWWERPVTYARVVMKGGRRVDPRKIRRAGR